MRIMKVIKTNDYLICGHSSALNLCKKDHIVYASVHSYLYA